MKVYTPVIKGGRCFNANHKDAGTIIHGIVEDKPSSNYGWVKALCGTQPGYRGYGWTDGPIGKEINCTKCLKKIY